MGCCFLSRSAARVVKVSISAQGGDVADELGARRARVEERRGRRADVVVRPQRRGDVVELDAEPTLLCVSRRHVLSEARSGGRPAGATSRSDGAEAGDPPNEPRRPPPAEPPLALGLRDVGPPRSSRGARIGKKETVARRRAGPAELDLAHGDAAAEGEVARGQPAREVARRVELVADGRLRRDVGRPLEGVLDPGLGVRVGQVHVAAARVGRAEVEVARRARRDRAEPLVEEVGRDVVHGPADGRRPRHGQRRGPVHLVVRHVRLRRAVDVVELRGPVEGLEEELRRRRGQGLAAGDGHADLGLDARVVADERLAERRERRRHEAARRDVAREHDVGDVGREAVALVVRDDGRRARRRRPEQLPLGDAEGVRRLQEHRVPARLEGVEAVEPRDAPHEAPVLDGDALGLARRPRRVEDVDEVARRRRRRARAGAAVVAVAAAEDVEAYQARR